MARKTATEADVIVIGAGPAGSTAALLLARAECRVMLLDAARFPRPLSCASWLNARAASILDELGVSSRNLVAHNIDEVLFANKDFTKTARPKLKEPAGFLVERAAFDHALAKAAKAAGADLREEHEVKSLRPRENGVEVICANREPLFGRLLILATGLGSHLLGQVGLHLPIEQASTWTVHLEKPRPKRKAPSLVRAIVVVGLTPDGGFAMGFDRPDRFVVQVNMRGTQAEARAKLLEVCRGLSGRAYFGEDLTPEASKAICTPTFPFSALEMDSHVGKHTLTIGDAGGFFAAASHEGLYPAMWSAKIAVKVILEAHKSTFTQDGLISFDTAWRLEMGDFLRPPNTDLQLLLPLIFSNQPMADRMASAFFAGENI